MSLNSEWKELKTSANTENVLMTISDIVNYYSRGRININPSYQRNYQWTNVQKTKFIESLLLRYPIPPIIAVKRENEMGLSEFEIIDGVQRLSTIFEFMEIRPKNGELIKNISEDLEELNGANVFIELNGKNWDDFVDEQFDFIFESSTLLFTNLLTNDDDIKYEMFERLNSLSTELSPQEIRNSILAMKNPTIYNTIDNEIFNISKVFMNTKQRKGRNDMAFFMEFSLIKRYDEYINIVNERIKYQKETKSKDSNRHLDLLLSSYARVVKIDELLEDIEDYRDFIALNEGLYFKKYHAEIDSTKGNIISFFFEILSFVYFKSKNQINKDFYKNNFNESYADIMKNKLGKVNPNARVRFTTAKDVVEGWTVGNSLF